MMMPLLLHLEEYAVHNETNNQYETEERNDAAEYQNRLYRRVSQCGQNGQHHDTEVQISAAIWMAFWYSSGS